tara:strand:+ start:105 stop:503 length:399 start_codon:yes stop_codon:yes gene_type:complete
MQNLGGVDGAVVLAARVNRDDATQYWGGGGRVLRDLITSSELSLVIATPALEVLIDSEAAGVRLPGRNSDDIISEIDVSGGTTVDTRAYSQLAITILAPALQASIVEHCAGVAATGRDSQYLLTAAEADCNR